MNNRKITALIVNLVLALALALTTLPTQAAVPQTLNYQGQLANAAGVPVNNSPAGIVMTFKLYDAATVGNLLWSEPQTVVVSNGLYSVTLGKTTPLTPAMFGVPLFLGISVGTDAEMTPRIALSSAPFSLKADDAQTVGGFTPAQLQGSTGPAGPVGPQGPAGTQALFGTGTSGALAGTSAQCVLGDVWLTAGSISGMTPAQGQILAIASNMALFALLGTLYGGDGITNFALPDLRAAAPNGLTYVICVTGAFPARL